MEDLIAETGVESFFDISDKMYLKGDRWQAYGAYETFFKIMWHSGRSISDSDAKSEQLYYKTISFHIK